MVEILEVCMQVWASRRWLLNNTTELRQVLVSVLEILRGWKTDKQT